MIEHDDVTDQLRRIDPVDTDRLLAAWSNSDAKQAILEEAMMPTTSTEPDTNRRRRWPTLAIALAAVVGVGTVAVATDMLTSQNTTATTCQFEPETTIIINAVTGDPVADCVSEWEQQFDRPAPELKAYLTSRGDVIVVPADTEPEPDWQRVTGPVQDPAVLELKKALDDVVDGLASACHTTDEARTIAENELQRQGLPNWSVVAERGTADGDTTCALAYLDGNTEQVLVVPRGTEVIMTADDPTGRFARAAAAALADQCLTLAEAETAVRDAAAQANVPALGLKVTTVEDADADCTRMDVTVGGRIDATLRGPTTP